MKGISITYICQMCGDKCLITNMDQWTRLLPFAGQCFSLPIKERIDAYTNLPGWFDGSFADFQICFVFPIVPPVVVHNDKWTWEHIHYYLYEEMAFDNIVISPGPGSPTCPADIGQTN